MKEIECDVLVIGAGPAGSSAAWGVAREDLDVIIIEKKKTPKKDACAETLSKVLLEYLPFKIPDRFLKWELTGLKFYYEDLQITQDDGISWKSYPLNRNEFDPFVLDLAIKEGATFYPNTEFIDLKYNTDLIANEVFVQNTEDKESMKIKPKIIIAADGVESNVLKKIGKYKEQKTAIGYIKSYEFHDLPLDDYRYGHVFFGEFADGAYGYIFPKSETSANIGIATLSSNNIDEKFNDFLKLIKDQISGSEKVVDRSGEAPIKNPSKKISYGNIMFAGDAANQNFKPFLEGIIPGIICGSLAGKSAACCLTKIIELGDTYKKMINEKIGELFTESDEMAKVLTSVYENKMKERFLLELGIFSDKLNYKDLKQLEKLSKREVELFINEKLNS